MRLNAYEVRLDVHIAHLIKSMEIHKKDCQGECRNKQQKEMGWSVYAIDQNMLSAPAIAMLISTQL